LHKIFLVREPLGLGFPPLFWRQAWSATLRHCSSGISASMGAKLAGFVAQERSIVDHAMTTAAIPSRPRLQDYWADLQLFLGNVSRVCLDADIHRQSRIATMLDVLAHGSETAR